MLHIFFQKMKMIKEIQSITYIAEAHKDVVNEKIHSFDHLMHFLFSPLYFPFLANTWVSSCIYKQIVHLILYGILKVVRKKHQNKY